MEVRTTTEQPLTYDDFKKAIESIGEIKRQRLKVNKEWFYNAVGKNNIIIGDNTSPKGMFYGIPVTFYDDIETYEVEEY